MRQFIIKSSKLFLAFFLFIFIAACSDDDDNDSSNPFSSGNTFSMKIDGSHWVSNFSTLDTELIDDIPGEEYYYVYIGGTIVEEVDALPIETMAIYLGIPESRFNNPMGSYSLTDNINTELNHASAIYVSSRNDIYKTYIVTEQSTGSVEVTGFEIGEQTFMGQSTGEIGYTKLSGKFNLELIAPDDPSDKIIITDGQFNFTSNLDFGF